VHVKVSGLQFGAEICREAKDGVGSLVWRVMDDRLKLVVVCCADVHLHIAW
jgi:hypothetical protein